MTMLRASRIHKRFGEVVALDDASFEVGAGEVHALLGENGAGKSTLVRILAGIERPDSGAITLEGRDYAPTSPLDALDSGVAVVHQHDALIDAFSVEENLELMLRRCGAWVSRSRLTESARRCETVGIELPDPRRLARELSVGERQRVEIVRALATNPRLLILDEPTATLAPAEADALMESMRAIARSGTGVVFISHYLREVLAVADRITVLRRGAVVLRAKRGENDAGSLAAAMVGERISPVTRRERAHGEPRLSLVNATTDARLDPIAIVDVSLEIRGGECVGIAGVAGNGQRALASVLAGTMPLASGSLAIDGRRQDVHRPSVAERRAARIAIVPEDRRVEGLAAGMSVAENLLLSTPSLAEACAESRPRGTLSPRTVAARALARIRGFDIKAAGPLAAIETLSGGNQQRVVLARELDHRPAVVLLVQPTRGLDPKATLFVRDHIERLRERGAAILLISSDLDEVREVCDRCLVMLRGRIVAEFPREASAGEIGRAMSGAEAPR